MNDSDPKPAITPEMKVASLLEAYPALETTLYDLAPAFAKLRNPILRRTVARATSLRQAARVAGVDLSMMITRLRAAVGQSLDDIELSDRQSQERPAWLENPVAIITFDACAMIEAGDQPMGKVMSDLRALKPGNIYELITPFEPAPLIDMARSKGFEVWSDSVGNGQVRTFFRQGKE